MARAYNKGRVSSVSLHGPNLLQWVVGWQQQQWTRLFILKAEVAVPLRFQAGGRRRRPNLGLVCSVHYELSVLLS